MEPVIRACPICGNPDLKWVGGGAYTIFDFIGRTSLSGRFLCNRCGKEVNPVMFRSREKYLEFVRKKRREEAARKGRKPGAGEKRREKKSRGQGKKR